MALLEDPLVVPWVDHLVGPLEDPLVAFLRMKRRSIRAAVAGPKPAAAVGYYSREACKRLPAAADAAADTPRITTTVEM